METANSITVRAVFLTHMNHLVSRGLALVLTDTLVDGLAKVCPCVEAHAQYTKRCWGSTRLICSPTCPHRSHAWKHFWKSFMNGVAYGCGKICTWLGMMAG
jgi:hypothetical protein